ncbi:LPXTG cell wall anchor domain-containing protein [Streptomyces monticola]|uniref:LPXTG cell wall anchor domain-containing protein n=1 Tax=Streptomyces monticola TaxID=2666263 RepID=A0ABW2JMS7_9ACTN
MRKDYQRIINDGGHPDQSQRDALADAKSKADAAESQAARCANDQGSQEPRGAMRTGEGGTSGGDDTLAVAGAGAVALAGAGLLLVRRNRSSQRS